jgi:hypothetical protein
MDMAANPRGKRPYLGAKAPKVQSAGLQFRNLAGASALSGAWGRTSLRRAEDFQISSSLFQTFPRKFLGFPNFSKLFQTFSLAVSFDIRELQAEPAVLRFFLFAPRLPMCPRAIDAFRNSS